MIYIRTYAYNAEKVIENAIKSILNQTYGEFRYYLLDNGSTDGTRDIIRKYAEQDARIVPFYADKNFDQSVNKEFWNMIDYLQEDDLFCILDGDDAYEPTFLEEMYVFLEENKLDMAVCGSKFVDATSGKVIGEKVLTDSIVIWDGQQFGWFFPVIHWNLRQSWGKLFTARVAKARYERNFPEWFPRAYGGDTANIYECVKVAERIGVYGKALHLYTVSLDSVSHRWIEGREKCDFILFEKAKELLEMKCGFVSDDNLSFLYGVQFYALRDTLNVLFGSSLPAERKIGIAKYLFCNTITKQVFKESGCAEEESKKELLHFFVSHLLNVAKEADEAYLIEVAECLTALNAGFKEMILSEDLKWYLNHMAEVVRHVALGEYERAINNLMGYFINETENKKVPKSPVVLGQMLTALRNDERNYVFFSKKLIMWYIEHEDIDSAKRELAEWMQLLPEDGELLMMQKKMENRND